MTRRLTTKLGLGFAILVWQPLFSIVYDTRFFPMLWHPYVTVDDRPSHLAAGVFFATARAAHGDFDKEMSIPTLNGKYDQIDIVKALKTVGKPAVLPVPFQGVAELPWLVGQKLNAQGVQLSYHQAIGHAFSCGFYWDFMNLDSWQNFELDAEHYGQRWTSDELLQLDQSRRVMHEELGLCGNSAHQVGVGDLDIYIRVGGQREYELKCRTLSGGARLGVLIPTGVDEEVNLPASLPFGLRHAGVYGALDFEIEVKEDWKGGMLLYLDKRFARTLCRRMPVGCEPRIFGPVVGPARIDPGVTFAWAPYASLENIRDGFGARIQYTLIHHDTDSWYDARNGGVPVNLLRVSELSTWSSEYVTVCAFYDFGKMRVCRGFQPIISLNWDIPVSLLVGQNFCKTNIITLGIEWNF